MKSIALLFIFFVLQAQSQTYVIRYEEKQQPINLDNNKQLDKLPAQIKEKVMADIKQHTSTIELYDLEYSNGISMYKQASIQKATTQQPLENSSNITVINVPPINNTESGLYKNFNTKIILQENSIMNKKFLVKDSIREINWSFDTATKTIGHFICKKATTIINNQPIEAWYTTDIPISNGPDEFYGLPGLILLVNKKEKSITATEIKIVKENKTFTQPNIGTPITKTEFTKLLNKKIEEEKEKSKMSGQMIEVN